MIEEKNLLDALFKMEEKEVETFVEVLKRENILMDEETTSRINDDRPLPTKMPEFTDQESGFVRINHGWHDQDYCWHISPATTRKPWKVSIERVTRAIASILNDTIPDYVPVKIWLPYAQWEIPEVTFKAFDLRAVWFIDERKIEAMNLRLFSLLNNLV